MDHERPLADPRAQLHQLQLRNRLPVPVRLADHERVLSSDRGGHVTDGYWNDVRLDGLHYVVLIAWPGEIAQGNGRQQQIIDDRASAVQRDALCKILSGESTAPGATHFNVFASTMAEFLDPIYAPIECAIDPEQRTRACACRVWSRAKAHP